VTLFTAIMPVNWLSILPSRLLNIVPLEGQRQSNKRLPGNRMAKDLGGNSGSKATPEAPAGLRPTGYDPGREELAALERAIDRMGWREIDAFHAELRKGQDVYEDAGGYFMRAIRALFGIAPPDPVLTYQNAARALVRKAIEEQSA
jgi:hypothetical protein